MKETTKRYLSRWWQKYWDIIADDCKLKLKISWRNSQTTINRDPKLKLKISWCNSQTTINRAAPKFKRLMVWSRSTCFSWQNQSAQKECSYVTLGHAILRGHSFKPRLCFTDFHKNISNPYFNKNQYSFSTRVFICRNFSSRVRGSIRVISTRIEG